MYTHIHNVTNYWQKSVTKSIITKLMPIISNMTFPLKKYQIIKKNTSLCARSNISCLKIYNSNFLEKKVFLLFYEKTLFLRNFFWKYTFKYCNLVRNCDQISERWMCHCSIKLIQRMLFHGTQFSSWRRDLPPNLKLHFLSLFFRCSYIWLEFCKYKPIYQDMSAKRFNQLMLEWK